MSRFSKYPLLLVFLLFCGTVWGQTPQVTIFFSTTCPICQAHTQTLRNLSEKWEKKVDFRLVFTRYDKPRDIRAFKRKYQLEQRSKRDRKGKWLEKYGATHTPEVFLENAAGEVVYRGRINNLYESLGVRRGVVTERYLDEALEALSSGNPIPIAKTPPIGCLIARPKRVN